MKRKFLFDIRGEEHLKNVVTIPEAAALTHYAPRTIRFWCDAGYIVARRAGRVWLISKPSLEKLVKSKNTP